MTIKDSKIWTVIISINPTDIPVVPSVFHSRRWVMDTLLVCDSLPGDGADEMRTRFSYEYGYHDHTEREFLGFAKITTENLDENAVVLRYTERYYANSDIHTSGQLLAEVLYAGDGRKYIQTVNTLEKDTLTGFGEQIAVRVFPKLVRTQTCYFEGQPQAGITAVQTYTYENTYGNLVHQTSESTSQPLIHTNISYHPQQNGNYCVNRPSDVEIRDARGCLRRRTTRIDPMGHITEIHDTVDNSYQVLVTRMSYDAYGNVVTLRSPNTTVHYTYDNFVHTYPTAIEDTFGVKSCMQAYDFRFGIPQLVKDPAGHKMIYIIDKWGRTESIQSPKEYAFGVPYTLKYRYNRKETGCAVSMAVTEHYDPQHPQNPIKTYTYCDGLGRIVQTRKEAAVNGVEKLVISGHTVVDALGRTVASYYPTESSLQDTAFAFVTDNITPATVTCDVMDRPVEQTAPDGSTTSFEYGFSYSNDLNKMLFSTVTTDANGHSSTELRDVDGKPWAVQAAGQPFVYFDYNAVGDNTRTYAETGEWERSYTCDLLGRKTTYTEGQLFEEYRYDGQNLSIHIQDWYEDGGVRICTTWYSYTAHRLDSVESDDALTVIYHYNNYGQIDSLYDESGVMCYEYGNMGEVTKETRIYALPFLSQPIAISTGFEYDSWGRVQSITYPDGEVVHYAYDPGGQLERMYNSSYTYLDDVAYDRFGAKVSQTYGNGLCTEYDYWPDTRRLSNVLIQDAYGGTNSSMTYFYDPVGNITQLVSEYPWRPSETFTEDFIYDDADQLTTAYESNYGTYSLFSSYGDYGKIGYYYLSGGTQNVEYYTQYPSCPSELESAQTPFAPLHSDHAPSSGYPYPQTTDCTYGINGSLRHKTTCFDPFMQPNAAPMEEFYLFAASGNMQAYCKDYNDFIYYGYDAANTRTYKLRMYNAAQWSNGLPDELDLRAYQAVFYPNQYLTFNESGQYTKHYYAGTQRIASRLGQDTLSLVPVLPQSRLQHLMDRRRQLADTYFKTQLSQVIVMDPYQPPMPVSVSTLTVDTLYTTAYHPMTGEPITNEPELEIYYYSVNHLGSTAFTTDCGGFVSQGFLYAPFGEIIDEYSSIVSMTYLPKYTFNAKELDEETGMYYYEARYYAPPVFVSRDPLFEKYFWMSPYAYCANNPVKYVDPSGEKIKFAGSDEENTYNEYKSEISSRKAAAQRKIDDQLQRESQGKKVHKGQLARAQSELNLYQGIENELSKMETAEEVFMIRMGNNVINLPADANGSFNYNFVSNELDINIRISGNIGSLAHEMKHGSQYLNNELGFVNGGLVPFIAYDQTDEMQAFERGALFGGTFLSAQEIMQRYSNIPRTPMRVLPYSKQEIINNQNFYNMTGHYLFMYHGWNKGN